MRPHHGRVCEYKEYISKCKYDSLAFRYDMLKRIRLKDSGLVGLDTAEARMRLCSHPSNQAGVPYNHRRVAAPQKLDGVVSGRDIGFDFIDLV